MVQAAASGIVDFREMKFFNKPWRTRLRLLLHGLQQENERRIKAAEQLHHTSLLGIAKISGESLERIQDRCQDDLHDFQNLLQPWAATSKEEREQAQVRAHRDRWQNRWGNLDSTETQRKIEETVTALKSMRELSPARSVQGDYFAIYNKMTADVIEGFKP